MLKSKNQIETNKWELEVEVDPEKFEEAVQKAYLRKKSKITIPGFRPGKAPRKMIETQYGEGVFYEDAINSIYKKAVDDAIKEAELTLVVPPEVEVTEVSKDVGAKFKATCITKPEIKLGDVKGIKVAKTVKAVTDMMIEHEIENMLNRGARYIDVDDRPAQNDDTVVIDFKGFVDGKEIDGGKAENYSLKLGSGSFIPGFEEQIVGHNIGDEFEINVTFPEDYTEEHLAGKPAVFKVKLHEIRYTEIPELDDDFVKDTTDFDTVDELRADVKKQLEEQADMNAQSKAEDEVIDKIIEMVEGEIPEEMYDARVDEMVDDFSHRLSHNGANLNMYLEYTGMTEESLRESYRKQAEKQIKLRLAMERYVEDNAVEVSDEEIDKEYNKLAGDFNTSVENLKQYVRSEELKTDIAVQKAIDEIKATAIIKADDAQTPSGDDNYEDKSEDMTGDNAEENAEDTSENV